MAEADRLRKEIKRLNQQILTLEKKIAQQKEAFDGQLQRKIEEYNRLTKQQIHAVTQEQQKQYEMKLAKVKAEIDLKVTQNQEEMVCRYMLLEKELEAARQAAKKWEEELQRQIRQLHTKQQKEEEEEKRAAQYYLAEADREAARVEKLPYETFFPGKMSIYEQNLKDAWNMMKQGISQAAAAAAVSVKAALERFSYDVEDRQKEWEKEYNKLKSLVQTLDETLQNWQIENSFQMQESQEKNAFLNYWSRGWYLTTKEWLNQEKQWMKEATDMGLSEYLRTGQGVELEQLFQKQDRTEAILLEEELNRRLYESGVEAAKERKNWVERLIVYLEEEKGYCYLEEQTKISQACVKMQEEIYFKDYNCYVLADEANTDDYHGWYQISFAGESRIRLDIAIIPSQEGAKIENRIWYRILQGKEDNTQEMLYESVKTDIHEVTNITEDRINSITDKNQKDQMKISNYPYRREWIKMQEKEGDQK